MAAYQGILAGKGGARSILAKWKQRLFIFLKKY